MKRCFSGVCYRNPKGQQTAADYGKAATDFINTNLVQAK